MSMTQLLENPIAGPTIPHEKTAASDRPMFEDNHTLVLARPADAGPTEEHDCVSRVREVLKRAFKLTGNLSVCSSCGRIGDDLGHWEKAQWPVAPSLSYTFRRTVCEACFQRFVRPEVELVYDHLRRKRGVRSPPLHGDQPNTCPEPSCDAEPSF